MPVYTVYHRTAISNRTKEELAVTFTDLHAQVTGAAGNLVKVIFHELDEYSFFSGGRRVQDYIRVIAQIRIGRTESQKRQLLNGMSTIVHTIPGNKVDREIQTQLVEIDDTKTVMTNGVLND